MRQIVKQFIRQYIFWMAAFAFARALYLIYNIRFINADSAGFWESMASFWYGLRLDTSTACYLLGIPF
ncbi:MAG: hypothetical protein KKA07_05915, partial [Bacteroidetes bacterium]|nr:hypothetical protein [Bacteroidota bacterium]